MWLDYIVPKEEKEGEDSRSHCDVYTLPYPSICHLATVGDGDIISSSKESSMVCSAAKPADPGELWSGRIGSTEGNVNLQFRVVLIKGSLQHA